jgi:D-3-phosphoglycerate dehydrogenase
MRVKLVNNIAAEGVALFPPEFAVSVRESDPQGIVVRSSKINVADYASLLAVARAGSGVNNITIEEATRRGICVFNAPGANANAVAELVMIMAGMGARNIYHGIDFCKGLSGLRDKEVQERVEGEKKSFKGTELAGKKLAVLGLGQIGVLVANKGLRQGMVTVGYDPAPALDNIHRLLSGVSLAKSIQELCAGVNMLTVHVPLNDKTEGMVNRNLLANLPDGAVLLNYSRGPVVVIEDVLEALDNGKLSMYICDFPSRVVLNHPKVLVTPHLGASTAESEEQCSSMAVRALVDYLEYGNISRSVNFPTVESLPAAGVHTRLVMINHDVPGMIGLVSQCLGVHNINIMSYLNESNGTIGYNIIDISEPVPSAIVADIAAMEGVIRVRTIAIAGKDCHHG